ncbi:MAG: hypothetical protein ACI4JF_03640 [Oscillospiraceae bacterium]
MLDLDTAKTAFDNMLTYGECYSGMIYCVFQPTGFFAGTRFNRANPGYAAVTTEGRLLTIQANTVEYFMGRSSAAAYDLGSAAKLMIRKTIFGQYAFNCVFPAYGKNVKVKFQAARKVFGSSAPEQESNIEEFLDILRRYEI